MFLTDEQVQQLTGLKRPSAQSRWLATKGIPHMVNAAGKVVVTRKALESDCVEGTREPKWEALNG